jgi:OOP family OmpA-OmpF porin
VCKPLLAATCAALLFACANTRATVAGHADSSGNSAYNVALSPRRAEAVRETLISDGVNQAAIFVAAKGE